MILEIILIVLLIGILLILSLVLLSMVIPMNIELGNPNSTSFYLKIKSKKNFSL